MNRTSNYPFSTLCVLFFGHFGSPPNVGHLTHFEHIHRWQSEHRYIFEASPSLLQYAHFTIGMSDLLSARYVSDLFNMIFRVRCAIGVAETRQ